MQTNDSRYFETYTVYFKTYDENTNSYAVSYEVRRGADVVNSGTHKVGYAFPFLAQSAADRLNDLYSPIK